MALRRIQVYADGEIKRRVELAAAKRNVPVTTYCLDAIMEQLMEDEVLEEEKIEIYVKPPSQLLNDELLSQMKALQEKIRTRRGGEPIGDDILEKIRSERDEELSGTIADMC